ncbi:MAG: MvaI/BcnI family restriction endonuclease [Hellea sp.]
MAEELTEISRLDQLRSLMIESGVTRLVFKRLAPNDNSKNQIYLGGDYSALQILPYSDVTADASRTDSKRDRFKAKVALQWLAVNGRLFEAPTTQLILYPKYPEVRLSGFLNRAECRPSLYLGSRDEGRILFLGITRDDRIVGHVVGDENPLAREVEQFVSDEGNGVLVELPLQNDPTDSRSELLSRLSEVYNQGWIDSIKLDRDGHPHPYSALNGGGYTLEAQLGVIPNGSNEPDFLGWEIKQHKSPRLDNPLMGGALTLMTPEPTGGHYRDHGAESFVRAFGYPDMRGRADRLNFGGVHRFEQQHALTGLTLILDGFDAETGKIVDINGGIVLRAEDGEEAAVWYYQTLIEKWTRKHAKAAYIPSHSRKRHVPQYRYGHVIGLGERSNISNFLEAMARTSIYYDPGIKLENASTEKPRIKKRSQFRISAKNLPSLYTDFELVDIAALG